MGRKEKDGFVGERERIGNEYGRKEQRNGTIRHNEGREY